MKRSQYLEAQIASAVRHVESGTPVGEVCPQHGISAARFYVWTKKSAQLGVIERQRLCQREEENARLKGLVAALSAFASGSPSAPTRGRVLAIYASTSCCTAREGP